MKIPAVIVTYCPFCRKHGEHKLLEIKKKGRRTASAGQRKFVKQTKGYKGKKAGKPKKVSQSINQTMQLECQTCKKKHPHTFLSARKKLEIRKKE